MSWTVYNSSGQLLQATDLPDDVVGVAELSATGTASSSTFLRGDNSWAAAGGIASVVADTTPQLGGNLDANGSDITGVGHIGFLASQNASAGANDLDDYEEGVWVPLLNDGNGDGTSQSQAYSKQIGRYVKIGRTMILQCHLTTSSIGSLSTSQVCNILGLPVASASVTNLIAAGFGAYATGLAITAGTSVGLYINPGDAFGIPFSWDATTGGSGLLVSEWSSNGDFPFGTIYEV